MQLRVEPPDLLKTLVAMAFEGPVDMGVDQSKEVYNVWYLFLVVLLLGYSDSRCHYCMLLMVLFFSTTWAYQMTLYTPWTF